MIGNMHKKAGNTATVRSVLLSSFSAWSSGQHHALMQPSVIFSHALMTNSFPQGS